MKNLLPFILIVMVLTSCTNSALQSNSGNLTDTTGLAQFQAWKAQAAIGQGTGSSIYQNEKPASAKHTVYYVRSANTPSRHRYRYNSGTNSIVSNSSHAAMATAKRGWSKAAKASVIGAGSGAIIGALVNKRNPLVGGIIGGLLGGGVGYGVGHSMDKRSGR